MATFAPSGPTASNLWVPHAARIERIVQEVSGIATYDLQLVDPAAQAAFAFEPGQFNMLYLPGFGEAAISISSSSSDRDSIAHTVRVAGNVTRALARKRVGQTIGLRGPFGSSWPMSALRGCDVILACGGVGLAPLRPVIYHILEHRQDFGRVHLLYGARTPGDLLYTDEYEAWRDGGLEVTVTVDLADGDWQGQIGVVPVLFYRLRLQAARTRVLTCGPEVMMRFVVFEALARRIRPEHIHISMERNMNCAVGLCGHCQLGPTFVCKDGPVFPYAAMEPYFHIEDL